LLLLLLLLAHCSLLVSFLLAMASLLSWYKSLFLKLKWPYMAGGIKIYTDLALSNSNSWVNSLRSEAQLGVMWPMSELMERDLAVVGEHAEAEAALGGLRDERVVLLDGHASKGDLVTRARNVGEQNVVLVEEDPGEPLAHGSWQEAHRENHAGVAYSSLVDELHC